MGPEPRLSGAGEIRARVPDLARLPVRPNFRAISIAEGVRAACAVAAVVALFEWLRVPLLLEAALGALLTCLCDLGGPIRRRVPWLLGFAALGGLVLAGFGLLRNLPLPVVLPVACLGIFLGCFARIYSQQAMQVGNLLTVVMVLALRQPLSPVTAAALGLTFLAGGLWAVLLTMAIWRVHPYAPARRGVADAFRALAGLVADLRRLTGDVPASRQDWDTHARRQRRAVRDAIEQARGVVLETVRRRGPRTGRAAQSLIRVAAADQIFGELIALSDRLEDDMAAPTRAAVSRLLRRLEPLLRLLAEATETDLLARGGRLGRVFDAIEAEATALPAPLGPVAQGIVERLRIAATLATPENFMPGSAAGESKPVPVAERLWGPIRANLGWDSAALRHAVRAGAASVPAFAVTLGWPRPYSYWLPMMLVLTMQPVFALTWQRALERIAGTLAGGAIAAALAMVVHTPLATAIAVFPLAIVTMALRSVSMALMMAAVTPLVVLLCEIGRPGSSELAIAGMRILYVAGGSLFAVLGCLLLWPSWEPQRLREQLDKAILAHAAYADAAIAVLLAETDAAALEAARAAAGRASNNLESSISRCLLEPGWAPADQLEVAMVADAALRRLAGRIASLQHSPGMAASLEPIAWRRWRAWMMGALHAMASGGPTPGPRPAGAAPEAMARMARQIELTAGVMARANNAAISAATLP